MNDRYHNIYIRLNILKVHIDVIDQLRICENISKLKVCVRARTIDVCVCARAIGFDFVDCVIGRNVRIYITLLPTRTKTDEMKRGRREERLKENVTVHELT